MSVGAPANMEVEASAVSSKSGIVVSENGTKHVAEDSIDAEEFSKDSEKTKLNCQRQGASSNHCNTTGPLTNYGPSRILFRGLESPL